MHNPCNSEEQIKITLGTDAKLREASALYVRLVYNDWACAAAVYHSGLLSGPIDRLSHNRG